MRIGIDVGGTHTDAVLVDGNNIIATNKSLTTADVAGGISDSIRSLFSQSGVPQSAVQAIMIGTTQFTNAVVERKHLSAVAIIRMALSSGKGCSPLCDWPQDIATMIGEHVYECHGGYLYDGHPIAQINDQEIDAIIADIQHKQLKAVAVASAFSSINPEPEKLLLTKLKQKHTRCESRSVS
jgi:N-methylhydantoinase A/oxoprolinase/acetone carboxylase beta subunit